MKSVMFLGKEFNAPAEYWKLASPTLGVFVPRGVLHRYEKGKYLTEITLPQDKQCLFVYDVFHARAADVDRTYLVLDTSHNKFLVAATANEIFTHTLGKWTCARQFCDVNGFIVLHDEFYGISRSKVRKQFCFFFFISCRRSLGMTCICAHE